jgi:hypothetical protein
MMRVAIAIQEGAEVCVYDVDGQKLFSRVGELYCYSSTVVIVRGDKGCNPDWLYVYDDTGYTLALKCTPGVTTTEQLLEEYRYVIGGEAERKELERLRERARHNEASALANARRKERSLWQSVVAEKDAALAQKDTALAEQAALIEKLMAQAGNYKA